MIKMKNCGDFVAEISVSGQQSTTAGSPQCQSSCIVPFNGRVSAIFARLRTAGTTSTQTTDLYKNGASVTGGNSIMSFATTTVIPIYTTASITSTIGNPIKVSKGDVLSVVNTATNTTAGHDLSVYLTIERQRVGTFNDPIVTDTIGADSDII
jgi:hypothetical protein